MKVSVKKIFCAAAFLCLSAASQSVFAINLPKETGFVNDYAGILQAQDKQALEAVLDNYEKQTSNEVVVVAVPSFEGLDRFSYAQALATEWGIGKAGKSNGILFLINTTEREAFIAVGKGLEGALPDSLTGTILRNEVAPDFKVKNYAEGVRKGVMAIIGATKGEYKPDPNKTASGEMRGNMIGTMFIFIPFFLSYMASFLGRTKSWWLGGIIGGAGGLIIGLIFWAGAVILISAAVSGGFGFLFDYIVSKNYQQRKAAGRPTDFWHSGGGFWLGGGRGGGRGGGGFRGFGGGSFGGGGAGIKW